MREREGGRMAQTLSHLTAYVGEGGRMTQTLSHLTAYVGEGGRENGSKSVSSDCLCGRGKEGE